MNTSDRGHSATSKCMFSCFLDAVAGFDPMSGYHGVALWICLLSKEAFVTQETSLRRVDFPGKFHFDTVFSSVFTSVSPYHHLLLGYNFFR